MFFFFCGRKNCGEKRDGYSVWMAHPRLSASESHTSSSSVIHPPFPIPPHPSTSLPSHSPRRCLFVADATKRQWMRNSDASRQTRRKGLDDSWMTPGCSRMFLDVPGNSRIRRIIHSFPETLSVFSSRKNVSTFFAEIRGASRETRTSESQRSAGNRSDQPKSGCRAR